MRIDTRDLTSPPISPLPVIPVLVPPLSPPALLCLYHRQGAVECEVQAWNVAFFFIAPGYDATRSSSTRVVVYITSLHVPDLEN